MKTILMDDNAVKPGQTSLNNLVGRLMASFQPSAAKQNSFFVNEVPGTFFVDTDENKLAAVIGGLFETIIGKSINSCIRISAKAYNNITLLHIKDSNTYSSFSIMYMLEQLQELAERLGGCISINDQREKNTTLTLSFFNYSNAA